MAQTKPTNMKLPGVTRRQIQKIKEATTHASNTAIVVAAVDFFYRYTILDEPIGQPAILLIDSGGVSNLPVSADTIAELSSLIGGGLDR